MQAVQTAAAVRRPWLGLALLSVLPYLGWWLTGLLDLDEGFYGAVTREMLRSGDWIVPRLGGEPWFEKPILIYWLAAPSVLLFGDDFGPRLPSVLCSLASAWALFRFARPRFGEPAAELAAAVWCTSLLPVAIGRMLLTDSAFVLALTGCLLFFWKSVTASPRWRLAAAGCLGAAVLAKGPAAGAFFLLIAGMAYWRIPSIRQGYRGGWVGAVLLSLAVMAAWYAPVSIREPQRFLQEFLIEQNLGRFGGGDLAHRVPCWAHPIYYPAVLALGFAPWLPSILRRRERLLAAVDEQERALCAFLAIWAGVIFVFFTLSGSKLVHYILPAAPPIALLAGRALGQDGRIPHLRWIRHAWAASVIVCGLANAGFWQAYARSNAAIHAAVRGWDSCSSLAIYRGDSAARQTEISLKINETSRPSLQFYFHGPSRSTGNAETASDAGCILVKGSPDSDLLAALARRGLQAQESDAAAGFRLVRPEPAP